MARRPCALISGPMGESAILRSAQPLALLTVQHRAALRVARASTHSSGTALGRPLDPQSPRRQRVAHGDELKRRVTVTPLRAGGAVRPVRREFGTVDGSSSAVVLPPASAARAGRIAGDQVRPSVQNAFTKSRKLAHSHLKPERLLDSGRKRNGGRCRYSLHCSCRTVSG
jgi:hypothetical protein